MTEDQKKKLEKYSGELSNIHSGLCALRDEIQEEIEDSDEDAEDLSGLEEEKEKVDEAADKIDDAVIALNNL